MVAFQIGGYEPGTVTDFEVPKKYGLRQTIADTLGIGGIMRGLRTVPHLWTVCEDMLAVCPDAILLQYVNPMAINTWAIAAKYPRSARSAFAIRCRARRRTRPGSRHLPTRRSATAPPASTTWRSTSTSRRSWTTASIRDLYPDLVRAYREGRAPKPGWNPRCPNKVRYEMLTRLGYFVTESSEHFAEYTPWFIKRDRPDLIEKFGIPLDEYPKRCVEQIARWKSQAEEYRNAETIEVKRSREYASAIMNSVWTGEPSVIYGNVAQPWPHHVAAGGLRRRGALPGRPQRRPADLCRRPAAAAHRAHPHQHQRPGADRRGADGRRTASTSTTPR